MKPIPTSLYHRILLPERTTTERHPALILLHGRGADEEDLIGLAPLLDPRFLIVSPRAPFPYLGSGGFTWYDVGMIGAPEPTMFKTSCDKLFTFVSDCLTSYPIDRQRVFLLGFSMGTVMSYVLALTQPQLFRGVSANSGYLPEGTHLHLRWNELSSVKFFITHGTLDPIIPVDFARHVKQKLESFSADLLYREYPMGHQMSEEGITEVSAWMTQLLDGESSSQQAQAMDSKK
jgi:phospholipase/carboxylesterase